LTDRNYPTALAVILLFCLNSLPPALQADAIITSQAMRATNIAEIFVDDQGVRVELEIGLADIESFSNLLPDEIFEEITGQSSPLEQRLQAFFTKDLVIRTGDDEIIPGYVVSMGPRERVRRDNVTGEPLLAEGETP
jgi:hypothetical protein